MSINNLPEAAIEAKIRLQKRICELGLLPELADEIIGHHTLVHYNKGAIALCPGSPAEVLFYVVTGMVKIYCPLPNGTRILLKIAGPGDIVGYSDCLDTKGRHVQTFEVETLTKSSLALLTRERILKILNALERTTLVHIIEQLNTAWSSVAQWFGIFLGMSFKQRLELVLNDLAATFGVCDSRGTILAPELTHADFAEMIGSSRPMVTRLMAEMVEQGALLRQGKRLILCRPSANQPFSVREAKSAADSHRGGALNGLVKNNPDAAATRKPAINLSGQRATLV
ncbi:MAG: Crp/Fnr family transcriptional regulator [Deltaproteobacteria bacterium]|nr:Crp/Fnr family transcriptional regulator [Deltaproteobacteria bacterium]